jgi:uncharacterized SAM-binding protein YcdF (DUF218 family)
MLLAKQLVSAVVLVPALPLLLAAVGLLLLKGKHRSKGIALIVVMLVLLWLMSCEAVVRMAYRAVEQDWPVWTAQRYEKTPAQAIVVLGGGASRGAAEYGGMSINAYSTKRLVYGLKLARQTSLPVLYSGGNGDPGTSNDPELSEAAAAQRLTRDMAGTELRWTESQSRDTRENAQHCAKLLFAQDIKRIALVTHAWHMQRAVRYFEREGFEVQPAPMGFVGNSETTARDWLPSGDGMAMSYALWRERLGLWVQRLLYVQ